MKARRPQPIVLHLGDKPEVYEVTPGWVAFVPGGTLHALHNSGDQDLELLTIMPLPLVPGVNSTYDARLAAFCVSPSFGEAAYCASRVLCALPPGLALSARRTAQGRRCLARPPGAPASA